jgi:hypothetical protein
MRKGGSTFRDASVIPNDDTSICDWINLPSKATAVSLWDSLHDAQIVSIRSDLIARSMAMSCDIEHLRSFHEFGEGFQFVFRLGGVQSARVLRYPIWPGDFSVPAGLSREEENHIIKEYQAKWREESASWVEFESRVTRENEQVLDVSDAAIAISQSGVVALKLGGHLNYATYHELYVRCESLRIFGGDGRQFELKEFVGLGETYWQAFSRREGSTNASERK